MTAHVLPGDIVEFDGKRVTRQTHVMTRTPGYADDEDNFVVGYALDGELALVIALFTYNLDDIGLEALVVCGQRVGWTTVSNLEPVG